MHSAAYAIVQCLSVCLSVTFMYCVEMSKHILKRYTEQHLQPQT